MSTIDRIRIKLHYKFGIHPIYTKNIWKEISDNPYNSDWSHGDLVTTVLLEPGSFVSVVQLDVGDLSNGLLGIGQTHTLKMIPDHTWVQAVYLTP